MSKFVKGDKVVSVRDIGGFARDFVPAGTQGVVIAGGFMTQARVQFTIPGGWLGTRRTVDVAVSDDEIT